MGFLFRPTPAMVRRDEALPGRASSALGAVPPEHLVFGIPVDALPDGSQLAYFALGCFWGEEKMFWGTAGVTNT
ncbi:MAG: peptide-methionine (S)-S-oxide reductase MsrA, partial [Brooklawnia sp.]